MNILRTTALIMTCCLPALAGQVRVPMTDLSSPAGLLTNTGAVTLDEETSGDRLMAAATVDWTVKNTSGKAIVTLIESLAIQYPSGYKSQEKHEYELFFSPNLMQSGDEISFSHPPQGLPTVHGATLAIANPSCEATLLWVQFSDGSSFGDSTYAAHEFSNRKVALDTFAHLRDVYAQEGAERFSAELQKKVEPQSDDASVDIYLANVATYYSETKDIQGAYDKLRSYLDVAESRLNLLN